MYQLLRPCPRYEPSYCSYIQELGETERYPFPLDFPRENFGELLKLLENNAKGIGIPKGFVPNSTFWLIHREEIVAVSNLRHQLTEKLNVEGGHIGFGVRPSSQGYGVGKELLRQTLTEARKLGIHEAILTCSKSNRASAGVITANGGRLESEYYLPKHSGEVQRYVISTHTAVT